MAQISKLRSTVGLASATSANGATRNGATLALGFAEPGSLSVQVDLTIVTGSVVGTFVMQVSNDATTWYDVRPTNNPAPTTSAATATLALCPQNLAGWKFFRCNALLSGATTAAGDLTAITYRYLRYGAVSK